VEVVPLAPLVHTAQDQQGAAAAGPSTREQGVQVDVPAAPCCKCWEVEARLTEMEKVSHDQLQLLRTFNSRCLRFDLHITIC
jgi:hypothetical protein